MEKLSWMVIVNPKAGMGYGLRDWPLISNQMNKCGVEFTCVFTEKKYHAVELTVKAINDGYRKIVAVGGDGTVNEIVNGIFIQKQVTTTDILLAVIPVGTGNDWVRMFGVPQHYSEAVKAIVESCTVCQDVALIGYTETRVTHQRYMANVAGIGFDAIANRYFNKMKDEGRKGRGLYIAGVIKALLKYKSKRFRIKLDNEVFFDDYMFNASIGIGPYNGGGMNPMPAAVFNDGLIDITIVRRINKLWMLGSFRKLYNGRIYTHPKVLASQARRIEVESFPASPIEIDGEALGFSPFVFEVVPESITVVVSSKFAESNDLRFTN
ncbi:MAG: diacylglycerol kinase family lipid kinase [Prevotellaceae bacterium]|jgi:YegS/Rv2252/BmrU family lipid kinase|nr:diacylglycerol kinase family lipid kinase [Prevotellaceae bacterium]